MRGRANFAFSTLQEVLGLDPLNIRVRIDSGEERTVQTINFCIANARYFGGGMMIAPDAKLTDGHLDVVKRYLHPFVSKEDMAGAPELYEPILRALVDSGTALEINTSGLRHRVGETYPSAEVVRRFHDMGGRAVTVGSDAHLAHHFGWALADGYRHATDGGFEALTFRRGGAAVAVDIPADARGSPNGPGGRSL